MAVVTGCRGEREKEACRGKGWGERKRKPECNELRDGNQGGKSLAVERAGTESRMPAARETGSRDTVPWGAEQQG